MLKDPIARRYFVMNFFDGIMTAFGLVSGGAISIGNSLAIIKAGMGASIAIMVSGFFGAYMAERAEREVELKELERHTLRNLKGSLIEKEAKRKSFELAVVDAFSPFLGAVVPLVPFFFSNIIGFRESVILSMATSFLLLVLLGAYLGKLTGKNPWKNALFFAVGGLIVGLVSSLFDSLK